jgi:hypothetical protein
MVQWVGLALKAVRSDMSLGFETAVQGNQRPIRLEVVLFDRKSKGLYIVSTRSRCDKSLSIDRHLSGLDAVQLSLSRRTDITLHDGVVVNCSKDLIHDEFGTASQGRLSDYRLRLVPLEAVYYLLFEWMVAGKQADLDAFFSDA